MRLHNCVWHHADTYCFTWTADDSGNGVLDLEKQRVKACFLCPCRQIFIPAAWIHIAAATAGSVPPLLHWDCVAVASGLCCRSR
ncbi:hypothetical protein GUJ93_ZPchr0011g27761 [Zizania palustris]|uniref:Uncharacterized protein n=1 Tax=Zizania palustris TaxID=103762 RepID=A0A8J5WFY6_ZIZPA|nr:hypothetical protein GUJ93_ZPchr0011g27761 [Zizania palustris]